MPMSIPMNMPILGIYKPILMNITESMVSMSTSMDDRLGLRVIQVA